MSRQRKKRGEAVTGWLILDKPEGVTSTQAVAICRRLFNAQKAGHGGTLDPLASGILPIAFGEATKRDMHRLQMISLISEKFTIGFRVTQGLILLI